MQKATTTLIALALTFALTPTTSADPATTYSYTSAAGYYLGDVPTHPFVACHDLIGDEEADACVPSGRGLGIQFFPNSNETCDYCLFEPDPVGAINYYSSDGRSYDNGLFIPDDMHWAENTAMVVCMYDPDGDTICDDDPSDGDVDVASDWACGEATVTGDPTDSVTYDKATIFVLLVALYDDFGEVCGATTGTVLGDLY